MLAGRLLLLIGSLATVVFSAGCGFHLHNPADEATARKAADTFKAADIGQFVKSERAVVQAAHERDLAATRRNVLAERDALIIAALAEEQTAGKLIDEIDRRQGGPEGLGFPKDEELQKALFSIPLLRHNAMQTRDLCLVAILKAKKSIKPPAFPPTDEDARAAAQATGKINSTFKIYKRDADKYVAAMKKLDALDSGVIGNLNKKLNDATAFQSRVKSEAAAAKAELDEAVRKYKALLADNDKLPNDVAAAQESIEKALAKFKDLVPEFEKDAKKFGLEDVLAEIPLQQLKGAQEQISQFMAAFGGQSDPKPADEASADENDDDGSAAPTAPPATPATKPTTKPAVDMPAAERAGRAAAILVKAAEKFREADARAKLVPLVFEQGRLKIEVARLERKAQRGRARIDLFEKQRNHAVSEGLKLMAARNSLTQVGGAEKKIEDVLTVGGTLKGDFVNAVFLLAESVGVNRLRREDADVALLTLDHDEALDASEFALELWQYAIATPLDELVKYHAAGLKPEDVSRLIQALSVTGIAVGVNN